jgi:hypothetical protein
MLLCMLKQVDVLSMYGCLCLVCVVRLEQEMGQNMTVGNDSCYVVTAMSCHATRPGPVQCTCASCHLQSDMTCQSTITLRVFLF